MTKLSKPSPPCLFAFTTMYILMTLSTLKIEATPLEVDDILRDCKVTDYGQDYQGKVNMTVAGRICLKWTDTRLNNELLDDLRPEHFSDGDISAAHNYCRHAVVNDQMEAPWCFYEEQLGNVTGIKKDICFVPKCHSEVCSLQMIGSSYGGSHNYTVLGKPCLWWTNKDLKLDDQSQNNVNFPGGIIALSENYCRNPNERFTPWCQYGKKSKHWQYCNTPVCNDRDTIVFTSGSESQKVCLFKEDLQEPLLFFIRSWTSELKSLTGAVISLYDHNGDEIVTILFGHNGNSVIMIKTENQTQQIKNPNVISSLEWNGFWIRKKTPYVQVGEFHREDPIFQITLPNVANVNYFGISSSSDELTGVYMWYFGEKKCRQMMTSGRSYHHFHKFKSDTSTSFTVKSNGSVYILLSYVPNDRISQYRKLYQDSYEIELAPGRNMSQVRTSRWRKSYKEFETVDIVTGDAFRSYVIEFSRIGVLEVKYDTVDFPFIRFSDKASPVPVRYLSLGSDHLALWYLGCHPEGDNVDGNWGEWGPWKCSAKCGGGVGQRTRLCNNPPRNRNGRTCLGPDIESGQCNNFPCGQFDPELKYDILNFLQKSNYNVKLSRGESHQLNCSSSILKRILRDYSDITVYFSLNGRRLSNMSRTTQRGNMLHLDNVDSNSNGIYSCHIENRNNVSYVAGLFAISVATDPSQPDVFRRTWMDVEMCCHGDILSQVFSDLTLQWYVNGQIRDDEDFVDSVLLSCNEIEAITYNDTGEWECRVEQEDLGFIWTTNRIYLQVHRPTHNIMDILRSNVHSRQVLRYMRRYWDLFLLGTLLVLIGIIFCGYEYRKALKKETEEEELVEENLSLLPR